MMAEETPQDARATPDSGFFISVMLIGVMAASGWPNAVKAVGQLTLVDVVMVVGASLIAAMVTIIFTVPTANVAMRRTLWENWPALAEAYQRDNRQKAPPTRLEHWFWTLVVGPSIPLLCVTEEATARYDRAWVAASIFMGVGMLLIVTVCRTRLFWLLFLVLMEGWFNYAHVAMPHSSTLAQHLVLGIVLGLVFLRDRLVHAHGQEWARLTWLAKAE